VIACETATVFLIDELLCVCLCTSKTGKFISKPAAVAAARTVARQLERANAKYLSAGYSSGVASNKSNKGSDDVSTCTLHLIQS
jgi:hypothetical protein